MATLTAYSAELTVLLRTDGKMHSTVEEAAINVAFIVLTTLSHCLGVKVRHPAWIVRMMLTQNVSFMAKSSE